MENRIEELASVVEWVDDMALEPKWRLNAVHAVRADGSREITGVRHLDTLRDRLRSAAWSAGSGRTCSTSSRRGPTPAFPSS